MMKFTLFGRDSSHVSLEKKQNRVNTSEGSSPSDWMKESTCLTASCGLERHECVTDLCFKTLGRHPCQLAKLYARLSMSEKSEMKLLAGCHRTIELNLIAILGFYSMVSSIEWLERTS